MDCSLQGSFISGTFQAKIYWNELPFPRTTDLSDPGTEITSLVSPAKADRFFTSATSGKSYSKRGNSNSSLLKDIAYFKFSENITSFQQNFGFARERFMVENARDVVWEHVINNQGYQTEVWDFSLWLKDSFVSSYLLSLSF